MNPAELERLVRGWTALQKAECDSAAYNDLFWSYEAVYDLVASSPHEALDFILAVLRQDHSPTVMGNLAAGPLEDLLCGYGATVIGRVEEEARENQAFANLLGGIWRRDMDAPVWNRVEAVRNQSGWDGKR